MDNEKIQILGNKKYRAVEFKPSKKDNLAGSGAKMFFV